MRATAPFGAPIVTSTTIIVWACSNILRKFSWRTIIKKQRRTPEPYTYVSPTVLKLADYSHIFATHVLPMALTRAKNPNSPIIKCERCFRFFFRILYIAFLHTITSHFSNCVGSHCVQMCLSYFLKIFFRFLIFLCFFFVALVANKGI